MNTDTIKMCFACRRDCGQEFLVMPHKGEDFGLKSSSRYVCAKCFALLNTSVALISVSDSSFKLQTEAIECYYKRLKAGQRTPYPQLLVRTGLTVFVKECYITRGAELEACRVGNVQAAGVEAAVASILDRRWMTMPDTVYEDDGLVKELPERVVADWRACREAFKRRGY